MIRRRLVLPATGLAVVLGAAGCTSGSGVAHSSVARSTAVSPVAAPTTGGTPVAAAALANRMQRALAAPRSVQIALTSTVTGETLTGGGELGLRSGAVETADVSDELPAKLGTIRLVRVGGTAYAKLPPGLAKRDRPWVVLDPHSSDVITAQIAGIATPLLSVASPATLVALVRSSPSVRDQGPTHVGAVTAHRYAVTVDPAHLPAGVPTALADASGGPRTVEVAVDQAGRPVQVIGTVSVSGLAVAARVVLTRYGGPVSIAAPPAGQLAR